MGYQRNLFGPGRFERWLEFHRANPSVYELFRSFAMQAVNAGMRRLGARVIWERIRWYVHIETNTADEFKLNDHYTPYYARLLMLREPQLAGVFSRRDARFDVDDGLLLKRANEIDGWQQVARLVQSE